MKLSHSKLVKIMSCPMSYRLSYEVGIWKKVEKSALSIGSAVHWGIEHNTSDLSNHFKEQGTFKQGDSYTREQILSEAMVSGYLTHKNALFDEILKDPETGEKLLLVDETHELYVTGKLKSYLQNQLHHDFVGIIDLLLLTDKGFVIVDYKTSTYEPNWEGYLDQIYRYIFMLQSVFPDVPIVKVGIINLRKAGIRQKKTENTSEFLNRLNWEYKTNSDNYINYHEFAQKDIDNAKLKSYIDNLSRMADCAQTIVDNRLFFINFSNATNMYGKSDFYDIFYHTPNVYVMYAINDYIWDAEQETKKIEKDENGIETTIITKGAFVDKRDCIELDMRCSDADYAKVLNKFKIFEQIYDNLQLDTFSDDVKSFLFNHIYDNYYYDNNLLEQYWTTLCMKKTMSVELPTQIQEKEVNKDDDKE